MIGQVACFHKPGTVLLCEHPCFWQSVSNFGVISPTCGNPYNLFAPPGTKINLVFLSYLICFLNDFILDIGKFESDIFISFNGLLR